MSDIRFIFLDDILRNDYKRNRLTVCKSIAASIKAVFDKDIEYYQETPYNYCINIKKFLELAKYDETDTQFWVKHYYKLPQEAEDYLVKNMPKNAIYFSYEAPEWLEQIMLKHSFKFVFLRMSYIRYLSDIPMMVSSNIPEVIEKVKNKYKFKDYQIDFETNLFKAMIFHNLNLPHIIEKYSFLNNALVVLGQTEYDASLKNKEKFDGVIRLSDYQEQLERKFKGYSKILYKPHPYANIEHKKNELSILEKISKNKVEQIGTNVYEMFSLPFNTAFLGLTSGSLKEAQYFGKDANTLAPFPFEQQEDDNFIRFINIKSHYIYSPKFWEEILGNYSQVIHSFDNFQPEIPDFSRNLNSVSWGRGSLVAKHFVSTREPIDTKITNHSANRFSFKNFLFSKHEEIDHTKIKIFGIKLSFKKKGVSKC